MTNSHEKDVYIKLNCKECHVPSKSFHLVGFQLPHELWRDHLWCIGCTSTADHVRGFKKQRKPADLVNRNWNSVFPVAVMEAQKRGSAKGKRKAESTVQQTRVGRDAFFNFMKKERHEMGKVANAKLDHKVQEEISNKWRKLNTTEKATYGSALEGSSGQVNDSVNEMSCITRCSPDRFHRTVEKLSNEKRLAIKAIGFGNVSSLSCTRLHRQLCHFLIQKFNPDTSSIELHGNVIRISADEFGRVMGLKNTGEDVQLDRPVEDEKVKQLVKSFGGNGKRVLVKGLAEQLEKCENANEDFKVRFVMFALGTILCPTSSPSVTGKYLTFLTIPGKIETKNWADHGFNFLCEGVRSFKAKKVAYVNGSLLFLQLLYFDSIVHGGVYVDKSLDPIVSWDNNSVWKMIRWVIKQGGFDSPTVRVVSQHRRTNEVSGVNVERIVQEVSISLAPVIQAEVKRSIEGLALGQIIQAEVQRSVLELTDKVMSEVRSFMKDARHEDVNQTKEDGPPKIRDEGGENAVKKKGEESRKLKEKGPVHVNNPWTPLPDGQTFSEPELKFGVEKRKFTKLARGDQSRIQTRRTAERRPGLHCREPWVDPSNAKGKAVQKTASKIKIGPFKLKPEDLQDSDFELFSYIFRSNNFSSEEVIIEIENEHHVTRDEFMCLRPEMWINDRVLNAQVYYLQEKGSGNWYFHTYMSEQVNNTSDGKLFELGVKLRREISKRFTVGLKKCEKMKVLDYIYNDEIVKHFDKGWQFAKFNIVRTDKARRQLNGCDCGIFVMNWLEDIECTSHVSTCKRAGSRCTIVAEEPKKQASKGSKGVRSKSCRRGTGPTWSIHPSSSHRKEANDTLPGKVESLTVGRKGLHFRN
ncbi:UB-like protease 1A [Prunus dulcis]|uniref:UB-like protease 1A n=2 Tax=Prunus dulcis TaxID=3755 RepID=A0A4Y1S0T0_PRUDU|nr:UB-like protease 1A [Prunus dulcis]